MSTFPSQVQSAYDLCPGTVRMEVYAAFSPTLTADVPCPWTTIPDAVIICYGAGDENLGSFSVEG
jgi:hypothetical protein